MKEEYNYKNNKTSHIIFTCLLYILLYFVVQIVATFIGEIIITVIETIKNPSVDINQILTEETLLKYTLPINIICQIISLCIFLPIYLNNKKKNYITVSKSKGQTFNYLTYSFAVILVGIISGIFMSFLENFAIKIDGGYSSITSITSQNVYLSLISVVLLAPILEEILFRGLIFNRLNSKFKTWTSIIISALIFGLIHGNIIQTINATILGIAFAYIYSKTHNLIPCIIGHFLNNLISIVEEQINLAVTGNGITGCKESTIFIIAMIVISSIMICIYAYKELKQKKIQ